MLSFVAVREGAVATIGGAGGNVIDFASERRRRGPRFDGGLMNILEVSRDLVCLCRGGLIVAINGAGIRLLGAVSGEEVRGRRLSDFLIPEYGEVIERFLCGRDGDDTPIPTRIVGLDNAVKEVELRVHHAREIATDAAVVIGRDVSTERRLAGSAQDRTARFTLLVDSAMNLVCHVLDGLIRYVNPAGIAMLQAADADAVIGRPLTALFSGPYAEVVVGEALDSAVGEGVALPMRLQRDDGKVFDAMVRITRLPTRHGMELMVEARDITAHNRAVVALRRGAETLEMRVADRTRELAEQRALADDSRHAAEAARRFTEKLVDLIPNPVWYRDARGRFEVANQAFRDLIGDPVRLEGPGQPDGDRDLMSGRTERVTFEAAFTAPDNRRIHALVSKTAYLDDDGRPVGIIGVVTDISERKALERELRRLATTDTLTDAFNRRHFMTSAAHEFARAGRHGHDMTVIMLDIDYFKRINDAHGHAVGDDAIRALVAACRVALREHDVLGRLGGEEFAVLLPETGMAGALDTAERLRALVAAIALTLENGARVGFTVSLGVATLGDDRDFEALLARADAALYRAKAGGRNRVEAG